MEDQLTWRVLLPISSAIAAVISAILVYRFTHRQSLRSNAERWLDCVRDDVAELVAVHLMAVRLRGQGQAQRPHELAANPDGPTGSGEDQGGSGKDEVGKQRREWEKQSEMLRVRLRLRLTRNTSTHKRLIDALSAFAACKIPSDLSEPRDEVVDAACAVVGETWDRIKTGYVSR